MSGAEFKALIEAFGLPVSIVIAVWFLLLKNGGLKTVFRDEVRDDIDEVKVSLKTVVKDINVIKTELAVLKDRSNRKDD